MAICAACKGSVLVIAPDSGLCAECEAEFSQGEQRDDDESYDGILLTTETAHDLPVVERLEILTSEVVIGLHLFKDIASSFRDVFGGRSKAMQTGLRDARKMALYELRREAAAVGADAVVGVHLNYSEISGGGKSMLFLVASGTAVRLRDHT
ncbi:YbjQ family protein [Pararhodobacter sp.]|uniref:YbjQ family protein n=1 Tax=Pararhodobacter sp. TaxID=2127056 RepID=UPI002AFF817E|nr:heavy metal-binding domain-containing protein [Pararhodobacter sp.]